MVWRSLLAGGVRQRTQRVPPQTNAMLNRTRIYVTAPEADLCTKGGLSISNDIRRHHSNEILGSAVAQAVSRWLPTATTQVRAQVKSCGICGGKNATHVGFLLVRTSRLLSTHSFH
jgi:hypothetical protein